MMLTCRLLLFLALTGWIYTGCEQHHLSETHVLYPDPEKKGHHGGHGHGDDHGHDSHGHDDHGDHGHDDHGHDDHKKKDDHAHDDHKKEAKAEKPAATNEEPRNLGI